MPNDIKDWLWWFFVSILLAYTINLSTDYMKSYEGVFYFVVGLVLVLFLTNVGYVQYQNSKTKNTDETKQQIEYIVGLMEYDSNIFTTISHKEQTYTIVKSIACLLYVVLVILSTFLIPYVLIMLLLFIGYGISYYVFNSELYNNIEFAALDEYIRRKEQQYKEYKL